MLKFEKLLEESKKKEDGLAINDLRRFLKQMMQFTKDKETLSLLVAFHNILAKMESKRKSKVNITSHNKSAKR